jgi:predicted nucleic acid-binding Zn ribbon protein
MEKDDSAIERLGNVLEKSLKRIDPSGRLAEYSVWPIWNEMVGDIIARNAQPDKIRQGTLFVKVSSHVWMQQLQYLKDTISEKLNHRLGGEVVKNIFFYVGEIISPVAEPATLPAAPSATQPAQPTTLNEQVLDSINDAEIRSGFQKLFAAHSRRPKS